MARAQNARQLALAILQRNAAEVWPYLLGKSNPVGYNFVFIIAEALQIRLIWMVRCFPGAVRASVFLIMGAARQEPSHARMANVEDFLV